MIIKEVKNTYNCDDLKLNIINLLKLVYLSNFNILKLLIILILSYLNMDGETFGIVGESGSGKSSICRTYFKSY